MSLQQPPRAAKMSGALGLRCSSSSSCCRASAACFPPVVRASTSSIPISYLGTGPSPTLTLVPTAVAPVAPALAFTVSCNAVVQTVFAGTILNTAWTNGVTPIVAGNIQYQIVISLVSSPAVLAPTPTPPQSITLNSGDDSVPFSAFNTVTLTPGVYYATLQLTNLNVLNTVALNFDGVLTATVINA